MARVHPNAALTVNPTPSLQTEVIEPDTPNADVRNLRVDWQTNRIFWLSQFQEEVRDGYAKLYGSRFVAFLLGGDPVADAVSEAGISLEGLRNRKTESLDPEGIRLRELAIQRVHGLLVFVKQQMAVRRHWDPVADGFGFYFPPSSPPSERQELVQQSREALRAWQAGDRKAAYGNLGLFILNAEAMQREEKGIGYPIETDRENLKRWETHVEHFRNLADGNKDPEKALQRIMTDLDNRYLKTYAGAENEMLDFLEQGKGNCDAQNRLILSTLIASGITLPENRKLGVQIFDDHVQTVIYDTETKEVYNLLEHSSIYEVAAPIYDPAILYWAYLQKAGEKSLLKPSDLLIAAANSEGHASSRVSPKDASSQDLGSIFSFPDTGYNHGGPAPDLLQRQLPVRSDGPSLDADGAVRPGTEDARRNFETTTLDELPDETPSGEEKGLADQLGFFGTYRSGRGPLYVFVFRDQELRGRFESLPTPEAKAAWLGGRYDDYLHSRFSDYPQAVSALYRDPDSLRNKGSEELPDLFMKYSTAYSVVSCFIGNLLRDYSIERKASFDPYFVISAFLKEIEQPANAFRESVESSPESFFSLWEGLSGGNKTYLGAMLLHASFGGDENREGALQALERYVVRKVDLKEGGSQEPPSQVDDRSLSIPPVRDRGFAENPWPLLPVNKDDLSIVTRFGEERETLDERLDHLPERTVPLEIALEYLKMIPDSDHLIRDKWGSQWNAETSRTFLRINRKGKYSPDFVSRLLPSILKHYRCNDHGGLDELLQDPNLPRHLRPVILSVREGFYLPRMGLGGVPSSAQPATL